MARLFADGINAVAAGLPPGVVVLVCARHEPDRRCGRVGDEQLAGHSPVARLIAVSELHDKEFLGRKLVVSGAKSTEREANYRG